MKIRNVSGEDRVVPALGGRLVVDKQVVDVPTDADVYGFTSQPANWEPADAEAQAAHDAATASEPDPGKTPKRARANQED